MYGLVRLLNGLLVPVGESCSRSSVSGFAAEGTLLLHSDFAVHGCDFGVKERWALRIEADSKSSEANFTEKLWRGSRGNSSSKNEPFLPLAKQGF